MNRAVNEKFDVFPELARHQLLAIRNSIFDIPGTEHIPEITETLKWGEPSYLSKYGSTVRLSWKSKYPDHVSVFFNCKTSLVETFRELYRDDFIFIENRELRFLIAEPIPMAQLMSCITMSLRYHKIKHLPLLGA